jgi:hypothetical protein
MRISKTNFVIVLTIIVFGIASCTKKTNSSNSNCGEGLLCATVDGSQFVSDSYNSGGTFTQYNQGAFAQMLLGTYVQFIVNGQRQAAQDRFNIAITSVALPTAGTTYTTTGGGVSYGLSLNYFKWDAAALTEYHWATNASHSGTLTLTKFDTITNLASGTFSFTGPEVNVNTTGDSTTKTITAGSFTDLVITR